jgi:hypothetical protein
MCDLRAAETVGPKADVWALGVSLYKLVFLRDLFGMQGEERLGVRALDMIQGGRGVASSRYDTGGRGVSLYKLVFLRDLFGMQGEERLGVRTRRGWGWGRG